MFCEKCGSEVKAGEKFCNKCGAPVKGAAQPKFTAAGGAVAGNVLKKKGVLIAGVAVILLIVLIASVPNLLKSGTYSMVKQVSFSSLGSETAGEIISENIKSPKWSLEKSDDSTQLVHIKGYSEQCGEKINITFAVTTTDSYGSYKVELKNIELLKSDEVLSKNESALVWASFYK